MCDVATALASLKYEVRCAALKQLVKLLSPLQQAQQAKQALASQLDLPELRSVLLRHLASETHHKGVRRTLCLLSLLPPVSVGAGAAGEPGDAALFPSMLQRAQHEPDASVRAFAVRCLGQLLRPVVAAAAQHPQQGGAAAGSATSAVQPEALPAQQAVEASLAVIEDCSQPWQLPELRLAAVAALESSGLLALRPAADSGGRSGGCGRADEGQLPEWLVGAAVGAWAVAVRLLEEEDSEIRDSMTAAAAAAAGDGSAGAACSSQLQLQQGTVEWVLRRVFEVLPARFGAQPALLRQLRAWVWALPEGEPDTPGAAVAGDEAGSGSTAASSGSNNSGAGDGGSGGAAEPAGAAEGRRLFDRELDNHHEEPLLIAQVGAIDSVRRHRVLVTSTPGRIAKPPDSVVSGRQGASDVLHVSCFASAAPSIWGALCLLRPAALHAELPLAPACARSSRPNPWQDWLPGWPPAVMQPACSRPGRVRRSHTWKLPSLAGASTRARPFPGCSLARRRARRRTALCRCTARCSHCGRPGTWGRPEARRRPCM